MQRYRIVWLTLMITAIPARAVVPLTAPSVPERVALADLIALGKVTAIEDALVEASPLVKIPGVTKKVSYRIAVVAIDKPLLGTEDGKRIRVGFLPPAENDGKPGRGAARFARVELKTSQE